MKSEIIGSMTKGNYVIQNPLRLEKDANIKADSIPSYRRPGESRDP